MKQSIPNLFRIIIGALFIGSAIAKTLAFHIVIMEILYYQLIPEALAVPGAVALLAAEFALGAFLLIGYKVKVMTWATIGLLALFLLVKVSAVARGIEACPACFGTLLVLPLEIVIGLNLLMSMMLVYVLIYTDYEAKSSFSWAAVRRNLSWR